MLSLGSAWWTGRSEPGWRKERFLPAKPFIAPILFLALLVVAVGCGEDAVPTTTVDDAQVLLNHGPEFCENRPNHPHCRDDEDDGDQDDDDASDENGYFVTILGHLDSGFDGVHGVSEQCRVVGRADNEPFVWDPGDPGLQSFLEGDPGGGALGVNGSGTIVGFAFADEGTRGFVWDAGDETRIEPLEAYEDHDASSAEGINDGGVITGGSWSTDPDVHTNRAFVLVPGSGDPFVLEPLEPTHGGDVGSQARGINNDGLVAGTSWERWKDENEVPRGESTPVVWEAGAKEPTQLTEPAGAEQVHVHGVNNDGDVVGSADPASSGGLGVLWLADEPLALEPLPGHDRASARALTDRDEGVIRVVGSSTSEQGRGSQHAVLWTVTVAGEVEVEDLGTPEDYHTAGATAVTLSNGEIVVGGHSEHRRGDRAAVLWTSAQDACDG